MKKVHAKFKGTEGTFAQFGDSITVTMAYWAPLQNAPKNASPQAAKAHELVKGYMKPQCWRRSCLAPLWTSTRTTEDLWLSTR